MKKTIIFTLIILVSLQSCCSKTYEKSKLKKDKVNNYLNFSDPDDQFTGGIKMIPIKTPKGEFKVWTKRVGNNPKIKVLLLHGGPGVTHEIYECFDGYFPPEAIEYIYYDQLGSYYSDQPKDTGLWTTKRFVEEVEQVRKALNLNKDNFYLYGQSWGGILAMEYALKYQENLKGLIISNMMSNTADYNTYAHEILGPKLKPEVLAEIKKLEANNEFGNPRYEELLTKYYYTEHILRMPVEQWPESVNRSFKHLNSQVYVYMQGYSEFGISGNATLLNWSVKSELPKITVPTLVIGSKYDTMDPKHMEWMSKEVKNGRFLYCPNGSHLSQYDDQKTYFTGLIQFLKDVDNDDF
jgi:proline iminopeptidase